MMRDPETALYPEVAAWLIRHLRGRYPKATVHAQDTHSMDLSAFLRRQNIHSQFKDYDAYEIQDITGIGQSPDDMRLAFVECKVGPITPRDVGQLLGYSLVARPEWSYLLSPAGASDRLNTLLVTFGRQDILNYSKNHAIRLASWNAGRKEVDLSTLIPRGSHI
ncbi:MAG: hypothetical protein ACYDDI_03330 [Candidatus Acidiferrales bacterium]